MVFNIIDKQIKENKFICPECGEPIGESKEFDTKEEFIDYSANAYTDHVFEHFWQDKKNKLKQLSKKEVAEEAFFQSIANFLHNFIP
jgi:competence CoiA-like predicted nuclease